MSITLTTPAQINSVLGGSSPVSYGHLVLSQFTMDPVANTLSGTLTLTSAAVPEMQPILGNLRINASIGELVIEVAQLDFYRRIQLSAGQITSTIAIIRNAQNALETGLINLSVVLGTQATGT